MPNLTIRARTYQQFDADSALDVPGEGYGGWREAQIEIAPEHTALVVMHAWDTGGPGEFPGWRRAVEYIPRAEAILRDVFPPLLRAVRRAGIPVFHVVSSGDYYRDLPGFRRAVELAGPPPPPPERVAPDPVYERLVAYRREHVFVGPHNEAGVAEGFRRLGFAAEARPEGEEGIAEDGRQLLALCRQAGVNHLIYCGFAVNWCLLLSPGGMAEMSRHGLLCSIVADATTAVENRESARTEAHKEEALWRVALAYGFVFESAGLVAALGQAGT